jgi:hypothetical protein
MSDHATHALSISELLARFFQAFDDKDWPMMRACLCDEVFADYSSFRGRPAATIPADRYVEQRRAALQALAMQHNFLNLRVEVDAAAGRATARCNYVIHRFLPASDGGTDDYFHSYGYYVFGFVGVAGAWKISRITQRLIRNRGNPELHGALRAQGDGHEGPPRTRD